MLGSRRAATTGTPSTTTLPQGTWAPWTATIGTTTCGSARTLGGPVGLERHRPQDGGEEVTAMPQPPGQIQLEAAAILLGVDDEHAARADHQVVEVGPAPGDGQVVQDHPALPLQGAEQPSGAPLPCRPAPPGDGVGAGPEPQPPADRHGREHAHHQAEPGHHQAAKDSPTDSDAEGGGRPPGQGPGPGGPLGRPAGAATARGPSRPAGPRWPAPAPPPPAGQRWCWPVAGRGRRRSGGRGWPGGRPGGAAAPTHWAGPRRRATVEDWPSGAPFWWC
jgi:hypothetical protein